MPLRPRTRPGVTEPVPRPLARLLREAVLDHATVDRRRKRPTVLHAGVPGRFERTFTVSPEDDLDHALRVDVVQALVRPGVQSGRIPLLWLTRHDSAGEGASGEAQVDREWLAAAAAAGAELEILLDLVVVTKHGWRDPRTGVSRRWKRIRRHS